jgi:hypothetical protein
MTALAGAVGGMYGLDRLRPYASFKMLGAAMGAAALVAGVAGFGAAWGVRELAERQPHVPTRYQVPDLPEAAVVPNDPHGWIARGTRLGRADAWWTTSDYVCTGSGDDQHCRWETDHHHSATSMPVRQIVGRMDGYPTEAAALAEHPGYRAVAVSKQGNKYFLHALADDFPWSRADEVTVSDPRIKTIVGAGGDIYRRQTAAGRFTESGTMQNRGYDPMKASGDGIARFARHRQDDLRTGHVDVRVSPSAGYTRLEDALGDAKTRPHNQAIMVKDRRLHVYDLDMRRPESKDVVTGLRTTRDAKNVVAIEFDDRRWVNTSGYWMTKE